MARHVAQRGDGVLELLQRRRVLLRDDQIDLVRQRGHRVVEADQVFRRRQPAQRVAHFGEPVLDAGKRAAVDAGLAAFGDALGQPWICFSMVSMAWRGIASLSARPISPSSARSALIASSTPGWRSVSIWSVIWRS